MPNRKTHLRLNLILGLPLSGVLCYLMEFDMNESLYVCGAFIFGTFFFHPDLDLAHQIKKRSLRGILALPFYPYSWLLRHRGYSHHIFLGTLTRVLYVGVLGLFVVYYLMGLSFEIILEEIEFFWDGQGKWVILTFFGLFLSDLFHVLFDRFWPFRA